MSRYLPARGFLQEVCFFGLHLILESTFNHYIRMCIYNIYIYIIYFFLFRILFRPYALGVRVKNLSFGD